MARFIEVKPGQRFLKGFVLTQEGAKTLNSHRSSVSVGMRPSTVEITRHTMGFPKDISDKLDADDRRIYPDRKPWVDSERIAEFIREQKAKAPTRGHE